MCNFAAQQSRSKLPSTCLGRVPFSASLPSVSACSGDDFFRVTICSEGSIGMGCHAENDVDGEAVPRETMMPQQAPAIVQGIISIILNIDFYAISYGSSSRKNC